MNRKKLISIFLSIFIFISISSLHADWVDNVLGLSGSPTYQPLSSGNFMLGYGGIKSTGYVVSYKPFSVTPPKLHSTPCGFDAFFGGFSMLNPDYFISLAQGIISAAPAYAFNLALSQMSTEIYTIMSDLKSLAQNLNNINLNSCGIMQAIGKKLELEKDRQKADSGDFGGIWGKIHEKFDTLNKNLKDLIDDLDGGSDEGKTTFTKRLRELIYPSTFSYSSGSIYSIINTALYEMKMCDFGTGTTCSNWNTGYKGIGYQIFNNVSDFVGFIRGVAGDSIFTVGGDGAGCANCTQNNLFTCFGNWLTNPTNPSCGDCQTCKLLSVETQEPAIRLDGKQDAKSKILAKVESGLTIKTSSGLYTISLENLSTSTNPYLWIKSMSTKELSVTSSLTLCYGGSGGSGKYYSSCSGSLQDNVKNKLNNLVTNVASTSSKVAIDKSMVDLVSLYYTAYRIDKQTGGYLSDVVLDKLSESVGILYVAGLLSELLNEADKVVNEIQTLSTTISKPENDISLCSGCDTISNWAGKASLNIRRVKAYFTQNAQNRINGIKEALAKQMSIMANNPLNKNTTSKYQKTK